MNDLIIGGLLALGGAGALLLMLSKPARKDATDPIACLSRDLLLTKWEQRSLQVIKRQLRAGYHVCPQVRLADLVQVSARDRRTYFQAATQVQRKSIDFVVVCEETGEAAFAIELDDKTHDRPDRQRRDICVNAVFKQIGIPLLRFRPNMSIKIPSQYSRVDYRPS